MTKKILLLGLLICFALPSAMQGQSQDDKTVYYFIRHAEKDRSDSGNKNPHLTAKGMVRAYNWASVFNDTELDMVYSTQYNRTIETARPTATSLGLEVLFYDPSKLYSDTFKKATQGKRVLVVGHSNTTPAFVNRVINNEFYSNIDDNNNGKLFVVTILNGTSSVEVFQIN